MVAKGNETEKVKVSKRLWHMFIMMYSLIRQPPQFAEASAGSNKSLKKV